MLTYDIAGAQIDGARDYQEDAFLITHLGSAGTTNEMSLCVVADGMGGHAAGNVASNIAVQTFNKFVTGNINSSDTSTVLRNAAIQANNSIHETVRETAALKGMGCTLVAALLGDSCLRWVSVGDSHLYLLRDGVLTKKNADHSYGGFLDRMAAEGTVIEPEPGFSRNMLMSALTGDDVADIDCPDSALALLPGDRLIIASDGLDSLSSGKILEYCNTAKSSKDCVDSLLAGVVAADLPRQDNTTIIAVSIAAGATMPSVKAGDQRPAAKVPDPRTIELAVDHQHEERSPRTKAFWVAGIVLAHVLIIGGAAWWFLRPQPEPVGSVPSLAIDTPSEPADHADPTAALDAPDTATTADATADPEPVAIERAPAATTPAQSFRDNLSGGGQGPLMIMIPAGSFQMGSPDSTSYFDQRPQRIVTVPKFALSVYEVAIADYVRFAGSAGRRVPQLGPGADRTTFPATFISWNDALAYTQWLSRQTRKQYRLPTEAEWEYAARAGTTGNYWWGHNLGSNNAHCMGCDTGLDPRNPTRVGRFPPNPFGLYDTSGNVQEWVHDCYHPSYDGAPTDGSVFEGGDCTHRVARGGAFGGGSNSLRSAHRDKFSPNQGNDSTGIRLVRAP